VAIIGLLSRQVAVSGLGQEIACVERVEQQQRVGEWASSLRGNQVMQREPGGYLRLLLKSRQGESTDLARGFRGSGRSRSDCTARMIGPS
jgi:hypothetical protein